LIFGATNFDILVDIEVEGRVMGWTYKRFEIMEIFCLLFCISKLPCGVQQC